MGINIDGVAAYLTQLQNTLCDAFSEEDGLGQFISDPWQRPTEGEGGGVTRILEGGAVFAKAAVNFSHIKGAFLPTSASAQRPELADSPFQALGVSTIVHPVNPYVPTMHANCRLFVADTPSHGQVWWFGGGCDLTPYYGFKEDCRHWHQTLAAACAAHGEDLYSRYKQWCDEYFYLAHRDEQRGIGGLFFDDVNLGSFQQSFAFVKAIGDAIWPAYQPIVQRRRQQPFGQREKDFQSYRRGRYVEFNLIYDRGTLFGLQSGGRTESILASMPPRAEWRYDFQAKAGSDEAVLTDDFLKPRNWLD